MNAKTFMMWNKSKFIICVSCKIYKWFYYMIVLQNVLFPYKNLDKHTAWKVSVLGVFLVWIFPRLDWILRIFPYSVQVRENTDQKNFKYGHFSHSDKFPHNLSTRLCVNIGFDAIIALQPGITKLSRIPFTHGCSYISGSVSNMQP